MSLSRLEGFGLTPLEAMASKCVVAGFTGGGGWEYAKPENGFWANEDDFTTCLAQIKAAMDLSEDSGPARQLIRMPAPQRFPPIPRKCLNWL